MAKKGSESRGSGRQMGGAVARLISIAAALVLFALVPVIEHAPLGTRNETGELREFGANLERVQSALGPGDLGVEERGLDFWIPAVLATLACRLSERRSIVKYENKLSANSSRLRGRRRSFFWGRPQRPASH